MGSCKWKRILCSNSGKNKAIIMFALAYKVEGRFDWTIDYNNQYESQDLAEVGKQLYEMNMIPGSHCEIKVVEI